VVVVVVVVVHHALFLELHVLCHDGVGWDGMIVLGLQSRGGGASSPSSLFGLSLSSLDHPTTRGGEESERRRDGASVANKRRLETNKCDKAEGSGFGSKDNGHVEGRHERVSDGDDSWESEGSPPASRAAMCLRFSLPRTHTPYDLSRISPVAAIPLVHASRHP
jgi:hypothetical protein